MDGSRIPGNKFAGGIEGSSLPPFPSSNLSLLPLQKSEMLNRPGRIEVLKDICRAMVYLHQLQIMHRDLKPPNVLVHHFLIG